MSEDTNEGDGMGILDRFKKKVGGGIQQPDPLDVDVAPGTVIAPASGELVAMEDIPDAVFAAGLMGEAVGIWPEDGNVYAPISGTVTAAVSYAVGIEADDGTQVLLHIGLGTAEMRGNGFTMFVGRHGDVIEAGECLVSFDRHKVEKAGHKDIVITVVTNPGHFARVEAVPAGAIRAGDAVLTLTPKASRQAG